MKLGLSRLTAMKIFVILYAAALVLAYHAYESVVAMAGIIAITIVIVTFRGTEKVGIVGVARNIRNLYIVMIIATMAMLIFH